MTQPPQADRVYITEVDWVNTGRQYASTTVEGFGQVTFSIRPDHNVWKRDDALPIRRAKVVLKDLRLIDGKWRAFEARYYRPDDEATK